MAVDITVGSQKFRNVSGYSVTEDSSPINPADSTGGFGYISFTSTEEEFDRLLLGKQLDLEDGINGTTQGFVSSVNSSNGILTVNADSRLSLLMAERQVQPFTGTLKNALLYYFGIAEITDRIVIDPAIASTPVKFIGWYGNLWDFLNKQLCPVYEIEIALVSDNIVVRPVRGNVAVAKRDTSVSWNVSNPDLARSVEVYWYNPTTITNTLVYPKGGWNREVPIYQVDASETLEFEVPVDVSLTTVSQPTAQDYVAADYSSTSVYSIIGNDGKPIMAAQWLAGGGSVSVSIGEDTRTLIIKVKGMEETKYAPYRIAAASGTSGEYYSTLRLIGVGIGFHKELLTVPTGVDDSETANLVGVTIDNPFIGTMSQAYDAARKAGKMYGGASHTINVSSTGINRAGASGNVRYPTYDEFAVMYAGVTYDQWAVLWGTQTYDDYQEYMYDLVRSDFDNQAFGNVAGARRQLDYSWYRIRTANTTETQVTYTAESDTLFDDLAPVWTGKTYDDWAAEWSGKTYDEFSLIPLKG